MLRESLCTVDLPKTEYLFNAAKAFESYSDMVYRLAFVRLCNTSDAEDVLSDVFLRLIKNSKKIKSEEHLKAWLIRATINCSYSVLSSAYRRHRADFEELSKQKAATTEESVLPLVLELPQRFKTVVYMYYYEGYSVEDIAKLCSLPQGTVKSRLSRARQQLKLQLKGEDINV
ncbi:MAG: RNA polymerase sigma factor [Clostridia bacterium]|nr:RNA polymerase sigma factor [Clostridia bacterium]